MSRKIMAIFLGIGAFLVVVLLGVGLKLSSDIKDKLEESLNIIAKRIHATPFTCTGFKNITCTSAGISDKIEGIHVRLAPVKSNALQFHIDLPKIHASKPWMPQSANCVVDLSLKEVLLGQNMCHFKSPNLTYQVSLNARLKDSHQPINLSNLLGSQVQTKDLEVLVEKLGVKLQSKDFRTILYPILQQSGDIQNKEFDAQAYDKALNQINTSFQGTTMVMLLMAGLQDEVSKVQELSKNFLAFAKNERDHVGVELISKDQTYKRLEDLINSKDYWEYLPHFTLKVLPWSAFCKHGFTLRRG